MKRRTQLALLAVAVAVLAWQWLGTGNPPGPEDDLLAAVIQRQSAQPRPASIAPASMPSPPTEDIHQYLQRVAATSATGYAHRGKPIKEWWDPHTRDVPTLLAAADAGDLQAAVYAAQALSGCATFAEFRLEQLIEKGLSIPTFYNAEIKKFLDGLRDHQDPSVRIEPLLQEFQRQAETRPFIEEFLTVTCRGAKLRDFRRAATLIEQAARAGNEDAKLILGARWADYAALHVGVLPGMMQSQDVDRRALANRYPEAAELRTRAQGYLVEAAHAGNLDAIERLIGNATLGAGGLPQSNEQAYFWKLVLHISAPDYVESQYNTLVQRRREFNADPANAAYRGEELPPFDPVRELDPGYNSVDPARVAPIRAAAEAMARRCCQRRPG